MRTGSQHPPSVRVLVFSFVLATVVGGTPEAQRAPTLGDADRIRIAEAFRLADTLGDRLWPGWSSAPFAVLLVTPTTVKLGDAQRSAFYPVGAGEGILLDRVNPGWRRQYAGAGFTLDGLLGGK